jgi:hypothetical protein
MKCMEIKRIPLNDVSYIFQCLDNEFTWFYGDETSFIYFIIIVVFKKF